MINGKTKVLGVLGNPIEHTLSPLIHNTIAKVMGIDQVYVAFECDDRYGAKSIVNGAFSLGIAGMNVTVPYKTLVFPYVEVNDPVAETVGAVNTLVKAEETYRGYNTDVEGLYRALLSENVEVKGRNVVILGAGGAARAALFMAIKEKAEHIYVLNRSFDKAAALIEEFKDKTGYEDMDAYDLKDWSRLPDSDAVCIQCSSVGLNDETKAIIEDGDFYAKKIAVLYDAVYKPSVTKAMKYTVEAGKPAYNGLKMLMYQGIRAFELFYGVEVSEDAIEEVYEELRKSV